MLHPQHVVAQDFVGLTHPPIELNQSQSVTALTSRSLVFSSQQT